MSDISLDDLYITHPGVGKSFHVFNRVDNRSLCGKFAMLRVDETKIDKVSGDEKYVKGQDCKACFRKAGLALSLLLGFLLASCGYQTAGRAKDPGLYECSNPRGGQIYRLHTEDPETLYFRGGDIALRFRDRLTGELVELGRDSGYRCAKIGS